jgi:hypothetical protein
MMIPLFSALFLAAALHAPGPTPEEARIPAALEFGQVGVTAGAKDNVILMPETIGVNEDFQVTIVTFGSGCDRAGDTGVILTAAGATIMVYDLTRAVDPSVMCTAESSDRRTPPVYDSANREKHCCRFGDGV